MKIGGCERYHKGQYVIVSNDERVTADEVWALAHLEKVIYPDDSKELRIRIKLPGYSVQYLNKQELRIELFRHYNLTSRRVA